MPKVKLPRKSTTIDMTAMCDVAFLLLTFFMLTTKFKPDEPVVVVTPSSISSQPIPDVDVVLVTADTAGRVFFSMDNKLKRLQLIKDLNTNLKLGLGETEMNRFAIGSSIGVPFKQLKAYLSLPPSEQKAFKETGVPTDTTDAPTNELYTWIEYARNVHNNSPNVKYAIKADRKTPYPTIRSIISTFKKNKQQKINLITDLEAIPPGTPAALLQKTGK